jgi:beta-lactamase superfamily II metal-dependent hydrolase
MKRIWVVVCLLCLVGTPLAARQQKAAKAKPEPLQIYFVDVEGGAATLIVTPAGESLLVDCGWPRDDARDARRIQAAAKLAGIKQIDHMLITHYHTDHWGGLGELAKRIPIRTFYDHGRATELAEDKTWFPKLNETYSHVTKNQTHALRPGDEIHLERAPGSPRLFLEVLTSNGEALKHSGPDNPLCAKAQLQKDDPTDNARSVGFALTFGKFRFLDLGDVTWNVEHKLVCPVNGAGQITLYQVGHHGMNISNSPVLLASIKPQVAVMNNGPKKGGHPDVVRWLREVPSVEDVYQLHRNMAAKDEENAPASFLANLGGEEDCQGNWVKVVVAPDGSSYTVTNGRTGQAKTYAVKQ